MSDKINLESLSNAELRGKCIELGLPNIPVTDTSRNVIIKRLRTALEGGVSSPAAKKATRRETIAVATERASPAKALNTGTEKVADARRTIANLSTTAAKDAATKIPESRRSVNIEAPKEQRRSVRASPVPKSNVARRTPTMIILDSDDEDATVLEAAQKVEQQLGNRRSSSRQPSLSRTSTVVTTEFQGLSSVAEETSSVMEQMRASDAAEKLKQQHKEQLQRRRQLEQQQKEQQQEEEERLFNQQRLQKQLELARSRYNAGYRHNVQTGPIPAAHVISQKPVQLETTAKIPATSRYENINTATTTYKTNPSLYPQLETVQQQQPTYNRASLATGLLTSRTSAYSEFSDDTDADADAYATTPKQIGLDSDDEKFDTPFLSEFARNLNRLKADPFNSGDLARRYTRSRTAQEVKGRVAMPRYGQEYGHGNWWENLVNFNNRYNILRHLFLVTVIFIVVYTFLKFWQ